MVKKEIKFCYCDRLYFVKINGRKNVLCFKDIANHINKKWYEQRQINVDDEAKITAITATNLIREEIRNLKLSLDIYSNDNEITDSINEKSCSKPFLLNTLYSYIVPETVKQSSIRQCIIKASQPRTASPSLLFGFGLACDQVLGPRGFVHELFKLSFSISYPEVNMFKKSVAANQSVGNSVINTHAKEFTQFVGDNVDHNIRTLDGSGTFHGMYSLSIKFCF